MHTPATRAQPVRFARMQALVRLVLKLFAIYVVGRLTIAIAVPAVFLNHDWVLAFKMQCLQRPDLCLRVEDMDAVVGKMWWGKAFYFTVRPGKEVEMRAYVTRDMPDAKLVRLFTPYNYVGIAFEVDPAASK